MSGRNSKRCFRGTLPARSTPTTRRGSKLRSQPTRNWQSILPSCARKWRKPSTSTRRSGRRPPHARQATGRNRRRSGANVAHDVWRRDWPAVRGALAAGFGVVDSDRRAGDRAAGRCDCDDADRRARGPAPRHVRDGVGAGSDAFARSRAYDEKLGAGSCACSGGERRWFARAGALCARSQYGRHHPVSGDQQGERGRWTEAGRALSAAGEHRR